MQFKPHHQFAIERLADIDPNWQLWNTLRLEPVKQEHGYPILAKAHMGPVVLRRKGEEPKIGTVWNYVGFYDGYYRFRCHEDDYGKLRTGITQHGLEITWANTSCLGSCPWWKSVTFSIRHVPSDRFITADGRVIYYKDLAEQLELF